MTTIQKFNVNVSSTVMDALIQKESTLTIEPKTQISCATSDYSDVVVIPKPITFISVHEYLPSLELNGDLYATPTCILLVQESNGKFSIEQGFLAKWTDEDHLFWYEDDAIDNVVGWMPYPASCPKEPKLELIKKLQESPDTKGDIYWNPDFTSSKELNDPESFMHVSHGLPPLHKETSLTIESDVFIVEYEYNTVNGIFTGLATSKLVFEKESQQLEWEDTFSYRHANSCRVARWKKIPIDVFTQFQV